VIQQLMDQGLFPYTKRYLGTLRNHFSTLGVNGINEMIRNFSGGRARHHQRRGTPGGAPARPRARAHGRIPGGDRPPVQPGSHAGRRHHLPLRQEDRKRWPDILQAGTPSRTTRTRRSCRWASPTIRSRRWRAGDAAAKYTGGTVLHLYMGERLSSGEACRELVRAR
jgi:ribonucleoside-triphosphate reductase